MPEILASTVLVNTLIREIEMLFDTAGLLVATDYYASEAFRQGLPCCSVRDGTWHLLLPEMCVVLPKRHTAYAMPFTAKESKDGWCWRITISGEWHMRLPLDCFTPQAPGLPDHGADYTQHLIIYGHWLPGMSEKAIPLGIAGGVGPEVIFNRRLKVCRITPELKGRIVTQLIQRGKVGEGYK